MLLEQGILFVCALHAVLLERGILKDLLVCALRAVVFLVSLMTFMDRQHSLTTRFVFMVSAMNIHGLTNRTTRTNRRNTIRAQWCEVKNC